MSHVPATPPAEPTALVKSFLELMQQRRLPEAQACLGPGFRMSFPGGAPMHRLEELVQWASGRYRSAAKEYERFDQCAAGPTTIVYCFGTLHGSWLDGTPYAGVRFIDRFEIVGGLIVRQDVWNDMAIAQAARAAAS